MALGLAGGIAAFGLTGAAVKAADRFFETTAGQGGVAAWSQESPSFRASTTAVDWASAARTQGVIGALTPDWSERSISGNTAALNGVLRLSGGGSVPVSATLVKDARGWTIQSVRFADAGLRAARASAPGETIAQACRAILARKANIQLDTIECPPISLAEGSTAICSVRRGASAGVLTVRLWAIDANGHADIDCQVDPGAAHKS